MSTIFNELLPKIQTIENNFFQNLQSHLQKVYNRLDKFEENHKNGRIGARETIKGKSNHMTTLQSIHEDEDETIKQPTPTEAQNTNRKSNSRSPRTRDNTQEESVAASAVQPTQSESGRGKRKRSRDEDDKPLSPEQEKRQKRDASVRAQNNITKQGSEWWKILNDNRIALKSVSAMVNVNLNQKMRRDDTEERQKRESHNRQKGQKGDNKENAAPIAPIINIKNEKMSILPDDAVDNASLPLSVEIKQEIVNDEIAMPPPVAPIPKARKVKERVESVEEESGSGRRSRRNTKTKKQNENVPQAGNRATRSNSATEVSTTNTECERPEPRPKRTRAKKKQMSSTEQEVDNGTTQETSTAEVTTTAALNAESEQPDPRPKRTRAKKKRTISSDQEVDNETTQETSSADSVEKPRPKRTRRAAQKANERLARTDSTGSLKSLSKDIEQEIVSQTSQDAKKSSSPVTQKISSPVTQKISPPVTQKTNKRVKQKAVIEEIQLKMEVLSPGRDREETRAIADEGTESTLADHKMNETVVLTNGIYNHVPESPKEMMMNCTVVVEMANRKTVVIDQTATRQIMNETVTISTGTSNNITDDDSMMTEDNSHIQETPPKQDIPKVQPSSAVKEKVQKFEELASRVTRTKTRAMAKKEEENVTPPDRMGPNNMKAGISADTLKKMNSLIFNGKPPLVSSSTSKLRNNVVPVKSFIPTSTSKVMNVSKQKEVAEESVKWDGEDARKKKEAILKAKKEQQKMKREGKMAAAAAARLAAERERRAALEAARVERHHKQEHLHLERAEKMREAERKKVEAARKAAEIEERRRAEEAARQQRLADEQRRADERKRRQEEAEAMKKEADIMAKEVEKRQREYLEKKQRECMEKQRLKERLETSKAHTPLKIGGNTIEPTYMQDGFEHLNSDSEDESRSRPPVPVWSSNKVRAVRLRVQAALRRSLVDRLFSVRTQTPDLRDIFPDIDRRALKRTSSAVWRTPPHHYLAPLPE